MDTSDVITADYLQTDTSCKLIILVSPKNEQKRFDCAVLVYVIGLHAVQFGNNWMKKIPRTAKIGRGRRPSPIWLSEEFFESNYFQIGQACSPLTY